jgi:hypothetical protein
MIPLAETAIFGTGLNPEVFSLRVLFKFKCNHFLLYKKNMQGFYVL